MSSQNKRPKLAESSGEPDSSKGAFSPPKGQSKISSFFKSTSTPAASQQSQASAAEQRQASILEALEVDEDELFETSAVPAPPVRVPSPARTNTSVMTNNSLESATTYGMSFLDRTAPEVSISTQSRIFDLDAEDQRELDKSMKQKEKNSEKYAFLEAPVDAMRRGKDDPEYDPRTLHIPANTYYNMTDFERQYWDIKSKYFNYVVFFQKGIFYELMEADAEIAAKELGLAPMYRAGMRSCGFSVKDGDSNAERLVQRGHSVVIVEQIETPVDRVSSRSIGDQATSSDKLNAFASHFSKSPASSSSGSSTSSKNSEKGDGLVSVGSPTSKKRKTSTAEPEKMLRRIISRILTPGTTPEAAAESSRSVFLLSVFESIVTNPLRHSVFGVVLFDTCSGSFIVGNLEEDDAESFTKLRTLLFYTRPREVLFAKSNLSKQVLQIIKLYSQENVLLRPRKDSSDENIAAVVSFFNELRSNMPSDTEPMAIQRARTSDFALYALSMAFDFLEETKNTESLRHASWLTLDDYRRSRAGAGMILDSRALENLCLLEDEERTAKNSIFALLGQKIETRFGRRMLFQWTCHPLQCPYRVESRLRCVDFLISNADVSEDLTSLLAKFRTLDLDRFLALASNGRLQLKQFVELVDSLNHIASAYTHLWKTWTSQDEENEMRRKQGMPKHLQMLLNAFNGVADTNERNEQGGLTEWALRRYEFADVEVTENAHEEISFFRDSFDRPSYDEDKKLVPRQGVCQEYDDVMARVDRVNEDLKIETNQVSQFYREAGIRSTDKAVQVNMVDVGNVLRLIEVPASWVSEAGTPKNLIEQKAKSTTKVKRYYTSNIENNLLHEWKEANLFAERAAALALSSLTKRLASCARLWWRPWIKNLAEIDCLLALAGASQIDPELQKRPKIFATPADFLSVSSSRSDTPNTLDFTLEQASSPFLALKESVHPLLATSIAKSFCSTVSLDDIGSNSLNAVPSQTRVISNDLLLGTLPDSIKCEWDGASQNSQTSKNRDFDGDLAMPLSVLLTGPNMGGKSTMLRQVCIATIMAQIGCYPFGKLAFTTVDRVFTRIGASDNIFEGRSTFMVELEEASAILKYATDRSIVILDELGRGTATFDGYALAYATLSHLALNTRCMTLFSTHYHLLTSEVETHELLRKVVSLFYMDALVDTEAHSVTFLYKMVQGICPQSYGMMVAAMAQIPREVVKNARKRSSVFQADMAARQLHNADLKKSYLQLASFVRRLVAQTESKM